MDYAKVPPSYVDIGKLARDLFSKGYHFGLWILDVKTQTSSGIGVKTTAQNELETSKMMGMLETKYKIKDYGLSLTGKWNTDNKLFGEVLMHDKITEGLMLGVEAGYVNESGDTTAKLKGAYGHENIKLDADTNIVGGDEGAIVNASIVVGFEGFLAGYQTAFKTQDSSFKTHNLALGFSKDQISVNIGCENGEVYTGAFFHRTSDKLNWAIRLSCTSDFSQDGGEFSIGTKYKLDSDATLGAKISTEGQVGLSYQQRLRQGITLTLSSMINGKDFNAGGHTIGIAMELEA